MFMIKEFHHKKEILILCYIISIFSVICYKWFIIKDYASQWIDEDQALLWYGTSSAARFGIVEPHFLGQAYGSMLESIIAVPLYWFGISLNYALPTATFFLWFAPFLICSLKVWKNSKTFSIIMILTSSLQCWDYDIIAGMPRSFISGFAFAFIGIILLIESNAKTKWKAFIAPLVLALAYINSETSITIIGLGILYYLLYCIRNLRTTWLQISLGFFMSILLILFCNKWFYIINPEYKLHGGANTMSFFRSVLAHNLSNIIDLASSFSIITIGNIPIILIATIAFILMLIIIYKQWKLILVFICAVIGSILFLAHPKSLDHFDTLFYSQTRMFLFIPYIILLMMFLLCISTRRMESWKSIIGVLVTGICIFVSISKIFFFETNVKAKDELYSSAVLSVINIEDIYTAANEIKKYANEKNCEIVVLLSDNRAMGYATGAINYSYYISYNAFYDRRSTTYLDLKSKIIDQDVLFVYCEGNVVSNMTSELVTGNLIDYIRKNKGIQRYPENSEYYISTK